MGWLTLALLGGIGLTAWDAYRPPRTLKELAGAPAADLTALEQRWAAQAAVEQPHEYKEPRTCMHDFPRSASHFDPYPGEPGLFYHECRDCGWTEGFAA